MNNSAPSHDVVSLRGRESNHVDDDELSARPVLLLLFVVERLSLDALKGWWVRARWLIGGWCMLSMIINRSTPSFMLTTNNYY